ncbi:MAG: methionyl-tRNA formyltransferase [Solirubrobacteraceae bacterium]
MRTVFLGTSEFAVSVLRRLADSPHRPVLVITRPDRPRGRGRRLSPPPVARAALGLGLELFQPESVNEEPARTRISVTRPERICVCAFGALIREPLLSEHELLNVHPSLLPRWRGAAPIERALIAGEARTGVSIMRLSGELDRGPVCLQEVTAIDPADTYGTLAPRLAELGAELLIRAIEGPVSWQEQDDAGASYAEKILAEDRLLDPLRPAAELERVVRALSPHIGARLTLGGGAALGVLRVRTLRGVEGPVGELLLEEPSPVLVCASGALELLEVQPAGGRPMSGADYLRGHCR